jgi:DNA-binding MarR family transcriptional regulator
VEGAVLGNLRRMVRALRVSSHAIEHDLGISGAQLFVLREIAAEPRVSLRRLAERTLTDPSSVSVVAARLVERRLVSRRRDPNDARRVVLTLTRRGHGLLAKAPEPIQVRLVASLRALGRSRLGQLDAILEALVQSLGIAEEPTPMFFDEEPRRRRRNASRS